MIVDIFFVYQFIKKLTTPFNKWNAFNLNIIDDKGNILKSRKDLTTRDEKESFTIFDNMVLKIKKLFRTLHYCPCHLNVAQAAVLTFAVTEKKYEYETN